MWQHFCDNKEIQGVISKAFSGGALIIFWASVRKWEADLFQELFELIYCLQTFKCTAITVAWNDRYDTGILFCVELRTDFWTVRIDYDKTNLEDKKIIDTWKSRSNLKFVLFIVPIFIWPQKTYNRRRIIFMRNQMFNVPMPVWNRL